MWPWWLSQGHCLYILSYTIAHVAHTRFREGRGGGRYVSHEFFHPSIIRRQTHAKLMLKYSTSLESAGHPHSQNPRRSLVHQKRVVLRPPPRWPYYYEGALALDDRLGDFMYTKFIQRLVPRRSGRRRSIKEKRVEAEGWNEDLVWKLRPLLGRPLPYFIGRSPPLLQNPMQKTSWEHHHLWPKAMRQTLNGQGKLDFITLNTKRA